MPETNSFDYNTIRVEYKKYLQKYERGNANALLNYSKKIAMMKKENFIKELEGKYILTKEGRDRLNYIFQSDVLANLNLKY